MGAVLFSVDRETTYGLRTQGHNFSGTQPRAVLRKFIHLLSNRPRDKVRETRLPTQGHVVLHAAPSDKKIVAKHEICFHNTSGNYDQVITACYIDVIIIHASYMISSYLRRD